MPRSPAAGGQPPDPALLILASLADSPKHGYAMIEDIDRFAGIRIGPGTLYGALARLEERAMIEPLPTDDRRRPYRLTGLGRETLEAQLSALRDLAETGLRRLAGTLPVSAARA